MGSGRLQLSPGLLPIPPRTDDVHSYKTSRGPVASPTASHCLSTSLLPSCVPHWGALAQGSPFTPPGHPSSKPQPPLPPSLRRVPSSPTAPWTEPLLLFPMGHCHVLSLPRKLGWHNFRLWHDKNLRLQMGQWEEGARPDRGARNSQGHAAVLVLGPPGRSWWWLVEAYGSSWPCHMSGTSGCFLSVC